MQRDPKGYVDGMSLYEYCRSGPIARFDALGTDADELKGVTRKHVKTGQTVTDVYYIDKPEFFGKDAAPRFVGTMDPNGKVTLPNGRITTIGQVYAEAKAWGTDFDAFQESNRTWDPDPDNNRGGTVGGLIGRQQRMEKAQEDAAWDTERKAVDTFDAKAYDKIFELGDAVRSAAYMVAAQWAAAPLGTLGTMQKFVPPAPSPTGTASSVISGRAGITEGIAGRQVTIQSAHGARHLAGTGLRSGPVETAIRAQVQQATQGASATGNFWGRVAVKGQVIEYRAFALPNGTINVGTYYPVTP